MAALPHRSDLVSAAVCEALRATDNDPDAAYDLLTARVAAEAALRDAIVQPILERLVSNACRRLDAEENAERRARNNKRKHEEAIEASRRRSLALARLQLEHPPVPESPSMSRRSPA